MHFDLISHLIILLCPPDKVTCQGGNAANSQKGLIVKTIYWFVASQILIAEHIFLLFCNYLWKYNYLG